MLNLEPIKARLAAATPGIWYFDVHGLPPQERGGVRVLDNWLFWEDEATESDTELIAAAPTDLAVLVAEVERLRAAIREHGETHLGACCTIDDHKLWGSIGMEPGCVQHSGEPEGKNNAES